ncbi:hypothetical protein IAR50_006459 [Cryptococcus sp. DSM 104548]
MTSSARISVSSSSSDEPQFISRSSSQAALAARPNPRKARSSVKEIEGEGDGETLASEESSMQGFAQKYKYKGAGSPSGTALRKTQSRDDALGELDGKGKRVEYLAGNISLLVVHHCIDHPMLLRICKQ